MQTVDGTQTHRRRAASRRHRGAPSFAAWVDRGAPSDQPPVTAASFKTGAYAIKTRGKRRAHRPPVTSLNHPGESGGNRLATAP